MGLGVGPPVMPQTDVDGAGIQMAPGSAGRWCSGHQRLSVERLPQHGVWALRGASVPRDPSGSYKFTLQPCSGSHRVPCVHSLAHEQVTGPDSKRRGCTEPQPRSGGSWAFVGDKLPPGLLEVTLGGTQHGDRAWGMWQ